VYLSVGLFFVVRLIMDGYVLPHQPARGKEKSATWLSHIIPHPPDAPSRLIKYPIVKKIVIQNDLFKWYRTAPICRLYKEDAMMTQFNVYVAEQTRQPEELQRAENDRLVRMAERAHQGGQKALGRLLIRSGYALMDWGCRLQGQMDCNQSAPAPTH
jgi:hypothetical protein